MTKWMEKIKFKPYRVLEPTVSTRKAEINLYGNHLEFIVDYDYVMYKPELDDFDYSKNCCLLPKSVVSVEMTEYYHSKDPNKTLSPAVYIRGNGETFQIAVETWDEA